MSATSVPPSTPPEICDALLIGQQIYILAAEPLAAYFALAETISPFAGATSGSGRGYQATWEIRDGRLYLIGLQGTLAGGRAGSLADLFPDFGRRVFAHWFSGTLHARSPRTAVGTIVLEGIAPARPGGPLRFEIERGIALPAAVPLAAAAATAQAAAADAAPSATVVPIRGIAA